MARREDPNPGVRVGGILRTQTVPLAGRKRSICGLTLDLQSAPDDDKRSFAVLVRGNLTHQPARRMSQRGGFA